MSTRPTRRLGLLTSISVLAMTTSMAQAAPYQELRPEDMGGWGDAWAAVEQAHAAPQQPPVQPQAPVQHVQNSVAASIAPMAAPIANDWYAPSQEVTELSDAINFDDRAPNAPYNQSPEMRAFGDDPLKVLGVSSPRSVRHPALVDDQDAPPAKEPVELNAEQLLHDRDLGVVTARGRVEIVQSGRTLIADVVNYNLKADSISASGNVVLMDDNGNVSFLDHAELTGDLKQAVAEKIRVLLADDSRISAERLVRTDNNVTNFENATYTACAPCATDPARAPIWQVNAKTVTHDQQAQQVEYKNVWMEVKGVPVMYMPYFSHPDPTVERQSGFLLPTPRVHSQLGASLSVPYFWAINDNHDVTIAPRLFVPNTYSSSAREREKNNGPAQYALLDLEHRWKGFYGETRTALSGTADQYDGDFRGHIDAEGEFHINNIWRAGFQIQRATDDTYHRLYGYPINGEKPWLTTRPYLEAFGRSSYFLAEAFAFQGLQGKSSFANSPVVLPHLSYTQQTRAFNNGSYFNFEGDFLTYVRESGTDATRLSGSANWIYPMHGSWGDFTTLNMGVRADGYHTRDLPGPGDSMANTGRFVPNISATWNMPFINDSATLPQVIEPVMMIAASPVGGNHRDIPNEDSAFFELDDQNVFRANRLPGLDRVEGGLRGAYGIRYTAYPPIGGSVHGVLAQGWRTRDDNTFGRGTGFDDQFSDVVGKLDVIPAGNLALLNRFRIDKDTGEFQRSENTMLIGGKPLRLGVGYFMLGASEYNDRFYERREYMEYSVHSALDKNWSVFGSTKHDLSSDNSWLGWQARVTYDDDCFAFVTGLKQDYIDYRDIESGFEITFNVVFKTLGDLPINVY